MEEKKIFAPGILKINISSFQLNFKPVIAPFEINEETIKISNLSNGTIKCVLSIDEKSKENIKKYLSFRIKSPSLTIKKNQEDFFCVQILFLKQFANVSALLTLKIEDPKSKIFHLYFI